MKKTHLVFLVGTLTVLLVGAGTVQAIRMLTKNEEIKLKQDMKPQDTDREVDSIGIFAPGFTTEAEQAKAQYVKEYGVGNFQVFDYRGYTLIVPPAKNEMLTDAKAKVDAILTGQKNSTPSDSTETAEVAKIREMFGVKGTVSYDSTIGAYTDERGFQYNFVNGELVNKQVGITPALHAKFEQAYPHLKEGVQRTAVITKEQARATADQVVDKAFTSDQAKNLKNNVQYVDFKDARLGVVYGNTEVQILIDLVTGDVIHYSKVK